MLPDWLAVALVPVTLSPVLAFTLICPLLAAAGIKSLKNKQGASQDSLKSTGPSQKNKDEIKETKSAPKAIPVEKNAITRQPVASSSFE